MTTQRDDQRDAVAAVRAGAPLPPPASVAPVLPQREPMTAAPVGRHLDGPTPPTLPTLGTVAPSPVWTPDGVTAVHRATNAQRREGLANRHRPSAARRVLVWSVIGLVVAVVAVSVVFMAQGFQDARTARSLPVFADVRPAAGTVMIEVAEAAGPDDAVFQSTVSVNPTTTDFEIVGSGGGETIGIVRSDGTVYVDDGVTWVELDDEGARQADRDLRLMTRISIFADYVPTAARPYVRVLEGDREAVRGRDVRRLEILLDDEAFRRGDRAAFDAWVETNGVVDATPDDRPFHFELWFDEDGVVWRARSESRNPSTTDLEEWVELDLISFDDTPFVAGLPDRVARTSA